MGIIKSTFLILISLASTFSWAAPPRISSDPRTNCELLLSTGRQIILPGATGMFKKAVQLPPDEMTFMTHNMRNFFSLNEKMRRHGIVDPEAQAEFKAAINKKGKNHDDLLAHARIFHDESPDLFVGQEIDGEPMWRAFNKEYLNDRFVPFLLQENSPRKSHAVVKDIGFLFNPDLPFTMRAFSHRQLSFRNPADGNISALYFRDLPVIEIFGPSSDEIPALIFISAHLISQKKGTGRVDDRVLRKAQFDWIASIIENRREKYGDDIGIILAGDLNIDVNSNIRLLRDFFERTQLVNPFNLPNFFNRKRTTHIFFEHGKSPVLHQLDVMFVSQSLVERVRDIRVVPHRDERGKTYSLPRNHQEKDEDLSDHYPVKMVLDTKGLF